MPAVWGKEKGGRKDSLNGPGLGAQSRDISRQQGTKCEANRAEAAGRLATPSLTDPKLRCPTTLSPSPAHMLP